MSESSKKYIDVIVPLPLAGTFTYLVSDKYRTKIKIGMRVIVPFGKKKMYTGIVNAIHSFPPELYEAKEIISLLDEQSILREPQLKFWEWISDYYRAFLGDVYKAAVPAGLKLESETQVCTNPDFEATESLTEREEKVLDQLSARGKTMSIAELNKATGLSNVLPVVKNLLEKEAITLSEELTHKFRPKTETYVRLTDFAHKEDNLQKIFEDLKRARKQEELLMKYLQLSGVFSSKPKTDLRKKVLLEQSLASSATLNSLIERNVLELYQKEIGRLNNAYLNTREEYALNKHQQKAFDEVESLFQEKSVVLLHGVTSSGKTELYIHLAKKALAQNTQVLYLVPEIALTTQLTSRLKQVFGNRLGVYHSKFSDSERVEIWNKILKDEGYDIIIGVRSSVFLPFRKLGLIIVDEEHETSYKQFDPSPRYHARNAAIVLAGMHGAKTLLGTATPAIETYFNAKTGKYGLVNLNQRHEELALPEVFVADLKESYRKKQMENHFSPLLLSKIKQALDNREQVILFQNRRGYAPYIECKACAYVPRCKNCDVSLTVHKYLNILSCHYCGYTETLPSICPVCKTPNLNAKGFGTEKIEDEIKEFFPQARTSRMDLDTTRSKKNYERIISDFEEHKVDILIGTQMISKGLDFERVSLVGVLNADNLLNFPDFRAHERAFQLLAQVSGRAGRKNKRGKVVLQTYTPTHPIIELLLKNDYLEMFRSQCVEREAFNYPPYSRLIQIAVRHRDADTLNLATKELAESMRTVFGSRVLGPNDPLVSRIKMMYIKNILLKVEANASMAQVKDILGQLIEELQAKPKFKALRVNLDVDPM